MYLDQANDNINWLQPVNWLHPLNRGLVGWWLAVQNQGGWKSNRWLDLTDPLYGNHGTLTNMDPATDWVRDSLPGGFGSLDFDGSDDHVLLETAGDGTFNFPQVTVSAWVKREAAMTSFTGICTSELDSVTENGYGIFGTTSNTVYFDAHGTGGWAASAASSLAINEWHHLTGMHDGGNNNVLFFDGVLVGSTAGTAIDYSGTRSYPAVIGAYPVSHPAVKYFPGKINDVRIYNRALSVEEVVGLYRASRQGYPNLLNRIQAPRYAPAAAGGFSAPPFKSLNDGVTRFPGFVPVS